MYENTMCFGEVAWFVANEGDGAGIALQAEGEQRVVLLVPRPPQHNRIVIFFYIFL